MLNKIYTTKKIIVTLYCESGKMRVFKKSLFIMCHNSSKSLIGKEFSLLKVSLSFIAVMVTLP